MCGMGVATVMGLPSVGNLITPSQVVFGRTVFPSYQGRVEGHATFVDGKMLSVTKYRIQILLV